MKANAVQSTDEWMAARAGCFTASRAGDLMARTKTGPSASRANLIATLAVERLTGVCAPTYSNAAMQRGIELEAEARDAYSFLRGVAVEEAGFIAHPSIERVGCSPDGFIGADGLLELKCPTSMQKHVDALRSGEHAREYHWQLQHQLWVTGRAWVDAVSYHPDFPEHLQLAVVRVARINEDIGALIEAVRIAEAEVMALVDELQNMKAAA